MTRISIITAVYNRASTLACAMESVLGQTHKDLEYIVVDGMSTDGTDSVVHRFGDRVSVSIREPDQGIYDALNKGLSRATGDVIGFLHADDFLAHPSILTRVAAEFANDAVDGLYGDLMYVQSDHPEQVVRYWKSGPYDARNFRWGWMPPHPTVYLRRACYEKLGGFRNDFHISADYELLLRMMVRHRIRMSYVNQVMVKMRVGGKSNASLKNRLQANAEDRQAWRVNGMNAPFGLRFSKPLRKLPQFWSKPSLETGPTSNHEFLKAQHDILS